MTQEEISTIAAGAGVAGGLIVAFTVLAIRVMENALVELRGWLRSRRRKQKQLAALNTSRGVSA